MADEASVPDDIESFGTGDVVGVSHRRRPRLARSDLVDAAEQPALLQRFGAGVAHRITDPGRSEGQLAHRATLPDPTGTHYAARDPSRRAVEVAGELLAQHQRLCP